MLMICGQDVQEIHENIKREIVNQIQHKITQEATWEKSGILLL